MKKRLLALMAKKNELKNQAVKVTDAAISENRNMTAEERAKFDDLKNQIEQTDEMITNLTALMDDGEGEPTSTPITHGDDPNNANENRFSNFGEQLSAVYAASAPANRNTLDGRLMNAASGAGNVPGTDGGFLVQEDFVTELLNGVYETGVLASKARRIPLSSAANTLKINTIDEKSRANGSRWGGVQAYWEGEADEIVGSKPKFKQLTLSLKKLTGLCYATDELLEDASAMQAVIQQAFGEEFGFKVDDAIYRGSGTGEPLGILNSGALVTINKETDQTAHLVADNIVKMSAACIDRHNKAEWYLNSELLPSLSLLKIGDTPIYLPGGSLANAPHGTLLGKPINFIEQAAAPGQVGSILLGDMSEYLLIDKSGINSQSSIHVRFLYDETAFRFIYRVDGQPSCNSTKAPYKGSISKSPFVTLGAI